MPKIVSNREKEMILDAIYQVVIKLIKEKGVRGVTVDEIAQNVNMAKGSFYKYYSTKEKCLYEVIKRSESEMFERMRAELVSLKPCKSLVVNVLCEFFIAEDSLVLYTTPEDLAVLTRKLPLEYIEREQVISTDYFEQTLHLLQIDKEKINFGVLTHLMNSLHFIASKRNSQPGREDALRLIVDTIAEYLARRIVL